MRGLMLRLGMKPILPANLRGIGQNNGNGLPPVATYRIITEMSGSNITTEAGDPLRTETP